NFELFDPHRVGKITVELQGRVNDCQALTYRQDIKVKDIEKYTTFKLPTRQDMLMYPVMSIEFFPNLCCFSIILA
ncbi:hypothetical protein Goarm_012218, partial [Gossypium armourianum]|nr:hypothetical protein [Gossypium armourianum]